MTELDELRRKISEGVRRYYASPAAAIHREKLRQAMKEKWKRLKEAERRVVEDVLPPHSDSNAEKEEVEVKK